MTRLLARRRAIPLLSEVFGTLKNIDGTDNTKYSGKNKFTCYKHYYMHIYDNEYRDGEGDLAGVMEYNKMDKTLYQLHALYDAQMSREWTDVVAPQLKDVVVPQVWYINDTTWRRSLLELYTNDRALYFEIFKMIDPAGEYEFNATITRLRKLLIEYSIRANPRTRAEWIEREYSYDPAICEVSALGMTHRSMKDIPSRPKVKKNTKTTVYAEIMFID